MDDPDILFYTYRHISSTIEASDHHHQHKKDEEEPKKK